MFLVTGIFCFKKEADSSNISTSLPPHSHGCDDVGIHEVCARYVAILKSTYVSGFIFVSLRI